ncbi:hypothetical protein RvY_06622-2 [Ramazzottius varieornatus]|nr:hypothetical protein RvY_06622-2 [Ramazzottius varieornatus]
MRARGNSSEKISNPVFTPRPSRKPSTVIVPSPTQTSPEYPSTPPACVVTSAGSPATRLQQLPSSPPVLSPPISTAYHAPSSPFVVPASIVVPAARPYFDKTPDVSLGFNFVDVLQAMRTPPVTEVESSVEIGEPFANIPSQPVNQVTPPKPTSLPQRVVNEPTKNLASQVKRPSSKMSVPFVVNITKSSIGHHQPLQSQQNSLATTLKPPVGSSSRPAGGLVKRAENLPIFRAATQPSFPALNSFVKPVLRTLDIVQAPGLVKARAHIDRSHPQPNGLNSVTASHKMDYPSYSASQYPKDPRIDSLKSDRKQAPEVSSSTELPRKAGTSQPEVSAEKDILLRLSAISAPPSAASRRQSDPLVKVSGRDNGIHRRDDARRKRSPTPDRHAARRSNPEDQRDRSRDRVGRSVETEPGREREAATNGSGYFRLMKRVRNLGERQSFEVRSKVAASTT